MTADLLVLDKCPLINIDNIKAVYMVVKNDLLDAYSFAIGIYNPALERIEYINVRENEHILLTFSIFTNSPERFSGWVFSKKKADDQ
jgi:hypothetical protein